VKSKILRGTPNSPLRSCCAASAYSPRILKLNTLRDSKTEYTKPTELNSTALPGGSYWQRRRHSLSQGDARGRGGDGGF